MLNARLFCLLGQKNTKCQQKRRVPGAPYETFRLNPFASVEHEDSKFVTMLLHFLGVTVL